MYGHVDGVIVPCQWGPKEKVTGYLLSSENEEDEDIIIHAENIPEKLLGNGKKVRIFGEIIPKVGFKEITVERIRLLDESIAKSKQI